MCDLEKSVFNNKICVPDLNTNFLIKNGKLEIKQQQKGNLQNILTKHSGASKKNIYEFEINGKRYISYIEDYKIPKSKPKDFINLNELYKYKFDGKENKSVKDLFEEIIFHNKINKYYNGLTPKIVSTNVFLYNNSKLKIMRNFSNVRFQIISESAENGKYKTVGEYIDTNKLDISFKLVSVKNIPKDILLFSYMKFVQKKNKKLKNVDLEFYSRFLNPDYFEQNLISWYNKTKKFFIPFFKNLYKLHKINVFHHDLHAKNVWKNNSNDFRFIDFGRSSTLKETLQTNKNFNKFLTPLQKKAKSNILKAINTAKKNLNLKQNKFILLKCFMLAELNYPDKLKPQGITQDFEFFRHDIDDQVMLLCFGKSYKNINFNKCTVEKFYKLQAKYYNDILCLFKEFISEKYAEVNLKQA